VVCCQEKVRSVPGDRPVPILARISRNLPRKRRGVGTPLSYLVRRAYGISGSIYRSKREWDLEVSSKRVVLDLSKYFSFKWRARSWRVPKLFFKAPRIARAALLRGYFDAEAYVQRSPRRIEVHMCNRKGLCDIRALLRSLGIESRIYAMSAGRSWKLHVLGSDLVKFERSIEFAIRRKQRTLHQIASHRQLTGIFKKRAP